MEYAALPTARPSRDKEFVRTLERLINGCYKTQADIADEIGYDNPNMITMFKTGKTRVPMEKVVPIATAIDADPGMMLRLWFETYMPGALHALNEQMAPMIVTRRERVWVQGLRRDFGNELPAYTSSLIDVRRLDPSPEPTC